MEDNSTSLKKAILLVLITGVISIGVTIYQENEKIEMERTQFQSSLIINAIDKNDIEASRRNLKFLIESELISKNNEKIVKLLTDTTFSIKYPKKDTVLIEPSNSFDLKEKLKYNKIVNLRTGQIVDETGEAITNIEILIDPNYDRLRKSYTFGFARTFSDKNGLFKIGLPDKQYYTLVFIKNGKVLLNKRQVNSNHIRYPNIMVIRR